MIASDRTRAALTGGLFLAAIFAYAIGSGLASASTPTPGSLEALSANTTPHISGALLMILNSLMVAGIGLLLFPVIKRHHPQSAMLYLGARLTEAILLLVGIVFLLLLVPLSKHAHGFPPTASPVYETLHHLVLQGNYWAYQVAMLVLGCGSIGLCRVLYRSQLIPRLAAAWGLAGYVLLIIGSLAEFYGLPLGIALSVPGGLFEVFLGIWLLVKGFRQGSPAQPATALS